MSDVKKLLDEMSREANEFLKEHLESDVVVFTDELFDQVFEKYGLRYCDGCLTGFVSDDLLPNYKGGLV